VYEGPGVYKHYKGNEYTVLGLGLEEATLKPVVIYTSQTMTAAQAGILARFWTRPLADFNAEVETYDGGQYDLDNDANSPECTCMVPRFKQLQSLHAVTIDLRPPR
jgi:hypothetical protein